MWSLFGPAPAVICDSRLGANLKLLRIVDLEGRLLAEASAQALGCQSAIGIRELIYTAEMRLMKRILVCIFFLSLVAPLRAQEFVTRGPVPAATSPLFEASAGYTYFALDTPSHQRIFLSGFDANALVDVRARWGLMADTSYARIGDVLGTGHSGNVTSSLIGPVFYPAAYGNTRVFAHTLGGVSLVDSAVPVQGTYYLGGTVIRFSYAAGGGVERPLAGRLALRLGGDYLRTTFADSNAAMRFQNNFRVVTSIVYSFGNRGR
jgi:hypothetical protein